MRQYFQDFHDFRLKCTNLIIRGQRREVFLLKSDLKLLFWIRNVNRWPKKLFSIGLKIDLTIITY